MTVVTRLHIESFKSAANVSLELGQINVLVGANGSGKTNILEALGVLSAAASGRVDDESLLRRGVRLGVPALYKSSFRGARVSPQIRFTAELGRDDGAKALYSAGLLNPIRDPQPAWRYQTEKWEGEGQTTIGMSPRSKDRFNPEAGLAALKLVETDPSSPAARLLGLLQNYAIYSPNTPTLRGLVSDPQQREPVGLSGGRLPEAYLEVLRPVITDGGHCHRVSLAAVDLIDWASDVGVASRSLATLSPGVPSGRWILRFVDRYMTEKRNVLTGYDASEGALYVLLCAVLGAHPGVPGLFAVDNFDQGLNPRLARELTSRFCSWVLNCPRQRQVLLTTHSPLVLDGLDLSDDRIRLFAVDRSSRTGQTVVQRVLVDERMAKLAADKQWPLSRFWLMGMIGGVPNV